MSDQNTLEVPDPPRIPPDLLPWLEALLATFPPFKVPKLPTADTPVQALAWQVRQLGRQDILNMVQLAAMKQAEDRAK